MLDVIATGVSTRRMRTLYAVGPCLRAPARSLTRTGGPSSTTSSSHRSPVRRAVRPDRSGCSSARPPASMCPTSRRVRSVAGTRRSSSPDRRRRSRAAQSCIPCTRTLTFRDIVDNSRSEPAPPSAAASTATTNTEPSPTRPSTTRPMSANSVPGTHSARTTNGVGASRLERWAIVDIANPHAPMRRTVTANTTTFAVRTRSRRSRLFASRPPPLDEARRDSTTNHTNVAASTTCEPRARTAQRSDDRRRLGRLVGIDDAGAGGALPAVAPEPRSITAVDPSTPGPRRIAPCSSVHLRPAARPAHRAARNALRRAAASAASARRAAMSPAVPAAPAAPVRAGHLAGTGTSACPRRRATAAPAAPGAATRRPAAGAGGAPPPAPRHVTARRPADAAPRRSHRLLPGGPAGHRPGRPPPRGVVVRQPHRRSAARADGGPRPARPHRERAAVAWQLAAGGPAGRPSTSRPSGAGVGRGVGRSSRRSARVARRRDLGAPRGTTVRRAAATAGDGAPPGPTTRSAARTTSPTGPAPRVAASSMLVRTRPHAFLGTSGSASPWT